MYIPSEDIDISHKVVMLGATGVGKTSIILQLNEKVFRNTITPTVGSNIFTKEIETANGKVALKIWDTAGEEKYKAFTGLYSRSASAGIIVYDASDRRTFQGLEQWMANFRENALEHAPMFLVGNKIDLCDKREVTVEEGREFALENHMEFYEVSAKTGENVELLFMYVAKVLENKSSNTEETVILDNSEMVENRCC